MKRKETIWHIWMCLKSREIKREENTEEKKVHAAAAAAVADRFGISMQTNCVAQPAASGDDDGSCYIALCRYIVYRLNAFAKRSNYNSFMSCMSPGLRSVSICDQFTHTLCLL